MWDKNTWRHYEPMGIIPKWAQSRAIMNKLRTSKNELHVHWTAYTYPLRHFTNHTVNWKQDISRVSWWHTTRPIYKPHPRHYAIPWCTGDYGRLFRYFPNYADIFLFPFIAGQYCSYRSIHHSHTCYVIHLCLLLQYLFITDSSDLCLFFLPTWHIPPLVTL